MISAMSGDVDRAVLVFLRVKFRRLVLTVTDGPRPFTEAIVCLSMEWSSRQFIPTHPQRRHTPGCWSKSCHAFMHSSEKCSRTARRDCLAERPA